MAGYYKYSMSNNAVKAYKQGEKPLSKWTKTEILSNVEFADEVAKILFDWDNILEKVDSALGR